MIRKAHNLAKTRAYATKWKQQRPGRPQTWVLEHESPSPPQTLGRRPLLDDFRRRSSRWGMLWFDPRHELTYHAARYGTRCYPFRVVQTAFYVDSHVSVARCQDASAGLSSLQHRFLLYFGPLTSPGRLLKPSICPLQHLLDFVSTSIRFQSKVVASPP
jgi:hypothetical protein